MATAAADSTTSSWTRPVVLGMLGGVVGAMAMAAFAMTAAATYQDTGFFTPLYHIGSAFGSTEAGEAMMASMERAGGGDLYHFTLGPAALGMAIHLFTGIGWGIVFGLLVGAVRVTRAAVVPVGVGFGLLIMLVMAYAVLPAVAGLFDSGPPIRDMATMVGWGTFAAEHALFGFVLGLAGLAIVSPTAADALRGSVERSRPSSRRVPAS